MEQSALALTAQPTVEPTLDRYAALRRTVLDGDGMRQAARIGRDALLLDLERTAAAALGSPRPHGRGCGRTRALRRSSPAFRGMTAGYQAVLDACVLVNAALRDTLQRIAESLYLLCWLAGIMEVIKRTLEANLGFSNSKLPHLLGQLRSTSAIAG